MLGNDVTGKPCRRQALCEEAGKLNTQSGDQLGIARATNEIANAYYSQGDLNEARPLYERAAAIAQTIGDKLDEAGALTNIANIKNFQGDLAGAKKAYEDSIAVARDRGDRSGQALAQQNLASSFSAWVIRGRATRCSSNRSKLPMR